METNYIHYFERQISVGEQGENNFKRDYSFLHPVKSTDLRWDFDLKSDFKVELKTDTYDMNKSLNYFLESYVESYTTDNKKIGGPWRALQDGVELFVYYFIRHGIYHWFDSRIIVEVADRFIAENEPRLVRVHNDGYAALGYLIPRSIFDGTTLCTDRIINNTK